MKKFIAAAIIASIATTPAFADSNNNTQPTTPEVVQVQESTVTNTSEEIVQNTEQQVEQNSIKQDIDYSFSNSQEVDFEQLNQEAMQDTTGASNKGVGGEIVSPKDIGGGRSGGSRAGGGGGGSKGAANINKGIGDKIDLAEGSNIMRNRIEATARFVYHVDKALTLKEKEVREQPARESRPMKSDITLPEKPEKPERMTRADRLDIF